MRILQTAQAQIIVILVAALIATLFLVASTLFLTRPPLPPLPGGPWPGSLQVAAVVRALHAAPPEAHAAIVAAVSGAELQARIGAPPACTELPPDHEATGSKLILDVLLGDRFGPLTVRHCAAGPGMEETTWIELPLDGATFSIRNILKPSFPALVAATLPLTVAISFLLVLVITLSLWILWRINRPLRLLASNAEKFGLDIAVAPLSERGPLEVRLVAQAFNRMQERITRSVEERTRMLMAVGHDLRTPLTRLKLRIEMDESLATRQVLSRDLDLMHKMINGALSFLNDQNDVEPLEEVDLGALIESICLEFADAGRPVTYEGGYGPDCVCQPIAITRLVGNLIENGCRYGDTVVADVREQGDEVVIEVRDDGPGIPASARTSALQPFVRLDSARASDGSLGLGLSIAEDIVRRHRGRLSLLDAEPTGLLVRIILPKA
jgi:signal transduction histidine kinase